MNVPRYEFSGGNTDVLLEFLKVAKEKKSNNSCNLEEYETFKLFCPLVYITIYYSMYIKLKLVGQ